MALRSFEYGTIYIQFAWSINIIPIFLHLKTFCSKLLNPVFIVVQMICIEADISIPAIKYFNYVELCFYRHYRGDVVQFSVHFHENNLRFRWQRTQRQAKMLEMLFFMKLAWQLWTSSRKADLEYDSVFVEVFYFMWFVKSCR